GPFGARPSSASSAWGPWRPSAGRNCRRRAAGRIRIHRQEPGRARGLQTTSELWGLCVPAGPYLTGRHVKSIHDLLVGRSGTQNPRRWIAPAVAAIGSAAVIWFV